MSGRRRSRALPQRTLAEVLAAYPEHRQSRLGEFDNCALLALFGIEGYEFDNRAQARGHIFHLFAAEVMRTLRRTGQDSMPVEEALAILYEVSAQRWVPPEEVVVVPAAERRLLRMAAIKLVHQGSGRGPRRFNMTNLIEVERRLRATVRYPSPDGSGTAVERTVTGQPDALVADPPDGAIVLDWKTTLQPPPKYTGGRRDEAGDLLPGEDSPDGVSYMGYFQQRMYALLVLTEYPSIQRVTLREFYPLADEARTATVHREQLEHIEREIAVQVELLDRALMGGSRGKMWRPQPGKHCTFCPKPTRCPIEADVRVFAAGGEAGGITGPAQARKLAAEYVLAGRTKDGLHEALKGWVEVHGAIPVRASRGRYEVRWGRTSGGSRRFGVWVPEDSDRGPEDESLEDAFLEAAERKENG